MGKTVGCPNCGGFGYFENDDENKEEVVECALCEGDGVIDEDMLIIVEKDDE